MPTVVFGGLYEHLDDDLQEESPQTWVRIGPSMEFHPPGDAPAGVRATGAGVAQT